METITYRLEVFSLYENLMRLIYVIYMEYILHLHVVESLSQSLYFHSNIYTFIA